jgi:DNA replication and repair protein RecF
LSICRLQVTDFRCLQSATLDLDARFTLISGANASGKTSLLEAIYVLGRGRSFRTRRLEHLMRRGSERFIVFGDVDAFHRRVSLGVEGSASGVRAKLGGAKANTLAELATLLPVQIIDPEIHHLIDEGPSRRRRFLDWGVFHVEPRFVKDWQRYQQVLKQRNAALKSRQPRAVTAAWDSDLVRCGEAMSAARSRYVDLLAVSAVGIVRNLLDMELSIRYRRGWDASLGLSEALRGSWNLDQECGATLVGPHRDELNIRLNGAAVKDRISRGQQKLLAAALLMAQIKLFPAESPVRPSLLLDDPAAELDNERLTALIGEVASQTTQLIVTTLHPEFSEFGAPGLRYRVHGGAVQRV